MYEKLKSCPVCDFTEFTNHIICEDHLISKESFVIVKCNNCGFLFTNPRPSIQNIAKFYDSSEYISHSNTNKGIKTMLYNLVRIRMTKKKLKLIDRYSDKKNILDYGCGTGYFLNKAKKDGWLVKGYEPNENALNKIPSYIKPDIISSHSELEDFKKFNVITLWHVLEHIHHLNETFELLKSKVKKKGFVFIAVPNHKSWDANYYKKYWAGYDLPRHLYHFNPETMNKFARKHDMIIRETIPLTYDAYYMALLSQYYKTNKYNYVKSIIKGFQSNKKALIDDNYSSLIYVLKKK